MPEASPKKKPKVVRLSKYGAWQVQGDYGTVAVYAPRGEKLTIERINWLLDRAKDRNMNG